MTNMNLEFNATEVKCNGILVGAVQSLTEDNISKLKVFLKTHFMMTDQATILQELEDSGILIEPWIVGRRVSDIDSIITRMASGLMKYATSKFEDKLLAEMWINSQLDMMTAKQIITVMESALIDCATADHWYTYEKQWD
jgi:hypothetical protein